MSFSVESEFCHLHMGGVNRGKIHVNGKVMEKNGNTITISCIFKNRINTGPNFDPFNPPLCGKLRKITFHKEMDPLHHSMNFNPILVGTSYVFWSLKSIGTDYVTYDGTIAPDYVTSDKTQISELVSSDVPYRYNHIRFKWGKPNDLTGVPLYLR